MVFHNEHIKKSSIAAKILALLYPDKARSAQAIGDALRLKDIGHKGTLFNLLERKLILSSSFSSFHSSNNGKDGLDLYSLTKKGRWFAICNDLHLSFLGLCALADAYCMQARLEEEAGLVGFYVYPRFAETFEGIYSQEHLRYAFGQLKTKKLAVRYSKKSLRIIPRVFSILKRYHDELEELQKWLVQIPAKKERILEEDQKLIEDIRGSKRILSRISSSS